MQQALGAGIRLAVPPEFSLTPPRGVPSVGEEPTATEDAAFESRFDVRRERARPRRRGGALARSVMRAGADYEYEGDAPSLGTRDCDARAVETIISARAQ